MDIDINILVEKAQKGDHEAFAELVKASEKTVFNIAYRSLSNREDAYEISQEVFIKAFKNINKFDGKSSFKTWIYRIAVNTCIDEARKRKNKDTISLDKEISGEDDNYLIQVESNEDSPEEEYIKKDTSRLVQDSIDKLSLEHKTIIILRDLQGLSYDEIASSIGISLGTVKSRLTRARKNLKEILVKTGELNEFINVNNSERRR